MFFMLQVIIVAQRIEESRENPGIGSGIQVFTRNPICVAIQFFTNI